MSDIAFAIGSEISPDRMLEDSGGSARARIGPVEPRAYSAYALGITHLDRLTRDGIHFAIDQFETAVAIEPEFARAWGQLAVSQGMLGLFGFAPPRGAIEKARIASLKTIEADGQFYVGHSMLGWVKLVMGDFDGGCEKFEEALRLNPSAPYALHGDADCLMLDGRMEESIARLRKLVAVDPFFAIHSLPLPIHLYIAGRLDEAIIAVQDMHMRVPHYSMHWVLALIYWDQGRFDKALEEERLELEWRGDTVLLTALDAGLDAAGPTGAMRAMAEALVARANKSYVDPFFIGDAFARAGMVDMALHWLDKAAEHGSYRIKYLAFWPQLNPVRNDPRYQDLLQRIYGERTQEIMRITSASRPQSQ